MEEIAPEGVGNVNVLPTPLPANAVAGIETVWPTGVQVTPVPVGTDDVTVPEKPELLSVYVPDTVQTRPLLSNAEVTFTHVRLS